ncbi:MAG: hypothetical protein HZA78_03890, partial [Candidatus Schekmanbacteria bacterium]|nr:hypothetical protein [Candidatus Schekmanbacteria bacterium]
MRIKKIAWLGVAVLVSMLTGCSSNLAFLSWIDSYVAPIILFFLLLTVFGFFVHKPERIVLIVGIMWGILLLFSLWLSFLKPKVELAIIRIKAEEAEKQAAEAARLARIEEEKRALPAELVILNPQFQDYNSFCYHDKILNAGEEATIEYTLKNVGKGIGFEVSLDINADNPNINTFNFNKNLGDIQPGDTKKITIPIKSGLNLRNGESAFLMQAKEKRGYHSQRVKLTLQTAALIPPKLEIQSVEINDGKVGLARGNGNGVPENNETVELIAYIRNSGTGDALGVNLDLASINPGLTVIQPKADIGVIHPGQTVKGKLAFAIPRTFKADELQYKLKVADVRGADSQSRQFAANFRNLSPALAYTHHIYDGNSANSKGNKNGIIENGETIEIEIIPKNTGGIEANSVEVNLSAPQGLVLNQTSAVVGVIPPQAQGEKKSFLLPVPRTYQQDKINLNLSISQTDFPPLNNTMALKVKPVRPQLTYTQRVIGNIQQGQSAELEVSTTGRAGGLISPKGQCYWLPLRGYLSTSIINPSLWLFVWSMPHSI